MTDFQPIELGDRVKDPVTGLSGICVSITTWLHGCIRLGVQPEEVKDGKAAEVQYFDQSQICILDKAVHAPMVLAVQPAPTPITRRSNGGPSRESSGFSK